MCRQIEWDCEFLEAEGIMDYSLLVGLHFRDDDTYEKDGIVTISFPHRYLSIFHFSANST